MSKIFRQLIVALGFVMGFGFYCSLLSAQELTWQDCIKEAARNHPDLISAQEQVKQSEASKRITASTLLPQVSSDLSGGTAKSATGATEDNYSYGVSGSQLLFDGNKTGNDVKAAAENVKATQYQYQFVSSDVRLRLRTAFINVLRVQEFLRITEEIYNIRRSNLVSITLRYESGLEHKGALLTAEANLAEAEYEIAQAKRGLEVAQRRLTKELGREEFIPITVNGNFEVADASAAKPDFAALVQNNPSLQQAMAQKNSADFGLKSSYAQFFPTLSGEFDAGRTNSHWPPQDDRWGLGLVLSFPIFEGGSRLAQKDQARALLNQRVADERSTKDELVVALEQTWAVLQDAMDNVVVQRKYLEAAEARAKIATAQYSLGLILFDNWTIIEDDLVGMKKTFLNAQVAAVLAEAQWIQAKGETLEYAETKN
jgi:outer membrane protein TolC